MEIHEATAVYVFTPDFERLLFIRHRKPPLAGRWLPPGGHVDPGETPEEGAVREVKEETGQEVVLLDLTPELPRTVGDRVVRIKTPLLIQVEDLGSHRHLDFVYVAVAPTPSELVTEPEQPAAWLTRQESQAEHVLEDCRGHAAMLFERRDHYRGLWERSGAGV
ncbi:MAG: hydrolase [Cyanobacteria bacterium RYN_339]|nr:hydrolase [Cyanobacteria bacterium RYN_339]